MLILPYLLRPPHPAFMNVVIVIRVASAIRLYMNRRTNQNLYFAASTIFVFAEMLAIVIYFVKPLVVQRPPSLDPCESK